MSRATRVLSFVVCASVLGACGGGSASAPSTQNKEFCRLYVQANTADTGAHGGDPAALTDPATMKKSWAESIALADKLRAVAPTEIADDMAAVVENLHQLDKEFAANGYDITAMSKDAAVRARMDTISTDARVAKAKANYVRFADKACGTSYAG